MTSFENRSLWLSLLTLLVLAVTFVVFYLQLCESKRQTGVFREQAQQATSDAILARDQTNDQMDSVRNQFNQTLGEMKKQSGAMQRAAKASSDLVVAENIALDAQTRPWIGIDGPIVARSANSQDDGMAITLKFRNYGKSPAIMAAIPLFRINFGMASGSWCDKTQDNLWDVAEQPLLAVGHGKFFDAVFPDSDSDTKDVWAQYENSLRLKEYNLILIGCIAYLSPTGTIYHTEVTYQIIKHDDGSIEFKKRDTEPR